MSLVSIFTRKAPTIVGIQFDAVFSSSLEAPVNFTSYPIESGARPFDHGILEPITYTMEVAISDNPLRTIFTDFAGGLLSNVFDSSVLSSISGLSAGFLSSSGDGRAAQALEFLLALRLSRLPFEIDTGMVMLQNMVITNISQTQEPSNEGAMFATVSMQEIPTLDTVLTRTSPKVSQLRDGDPSQSQIAGLISKGEQSLQNVGDNINSFIDGLFY